MSSVMRQSEGKEYGGWHDVFSIKHHMNFGYL